MRCYFMQGGHIRSVEVLETDSDEDAIEQSYALFRKVADKYEGFELWEGARFICRHPPLETDG